MSSAILTRKLVHLVIKTETNETNLRLLLEQIPQSSIAFDEVFSLVKIIAAKQNRFPFGIAILVCALKNEEFANDLASLDDHWVRSLSVLSEFRESVPCGVRTRDAIFDIFSRHRSEWE
jgi:hypothetical protein